MGSKKVIRDFSPSKKLVYHDFLSNDLRYMHFLEHFYREDFLSNPKTSTSEYMRCLFFILIPKLKFLAWHHCYISFVRYLSHEKKNYFPLYWLFNRDPYDGLLHSPHNCVVCHPLYTLRNQGPFFIAHFTPKTSKWSQISWCSTIEALSLKAMT